MLLQTVINAIYPPKCVACEEPTTQGRGLCGACWSETSFIRGLACPTCGQPLLGEDSGMAPQCDDCLSVARPWSRGVAALRYTGVGRRLVLQLKHGDRTDLVPALADWLAQAARPLVTADTLIVPVPLHWARLARRRFNQAALLAHGTGRVLDRPVAPDALVRLRKTPPLEGHSRAERFAALSDTIAAHPRRGGVLADRDILLIDDVMTSGATFAAAAEACLRGGARSVSVAALARVGRDT